MAKQPPAKTVDRAQEPGDRRIILKHDVFEPERIDVVVDPPIPDHPLDREFDSHRSAYGYASGLRMTLRLPIVDQTGDVQ